MTAKIIPFPKHRAHRADKYGHPAYRQRRYFNAPRVDMYVPKHVAHDTPQTHYPDPNLGSV